MDNSILVSKYTAIKHLISSQIRNTLSIYTKKNKIQCIEAQKIPLSKGREIYKVLYISGVAFWLSKSHNQEPLEIANAIASQLLETSNGIFIIRIVPPGWIYLELTHPCLAIWLQSLVVRSLEPVGEQGRKENLIQNPKHQISNPGRLFAMQYTHARCCSLILLAHREGLIKLREPLLNISQAFEGIIFTEQIPWLDCNEKLCLKDPDESCLITRLVQVVDDLVCSDDGSVNWEKAGLNLSQAFANFWSKCRIWGEVKIYSIELAQARLGLVMATQSVLRFLLIEKLGSVAPVEL